ncbi:MAG: MBL fold metallo-hydrolase [Acidimicrobiia bacterium]|nr:MAG: MBL fold metallo-hydrolase [Acidimicrobiia bacterium]
MIGTTLHVAGCRGSAAVSGPAYRRYGGNTSCYFAEVEPNHHLVIDAGTGLRRLAKMVSGREAPQRFSLLLTHFHWDHIQGLPVFAPLFAAGNMVDVWGAECEGQQPKECLDSVICRPWWPVTLDEAAATVRVRVLEESIDVGPIRVRHAMLNHPEGVAGFRLEGRKTVVLATDHEAGEPEADERLVKLAHRADVLIHDAQYTPEERAGARRGWGHSDWQAAAEAALAAGVGRLVLTSHDPDRDDDQIDALRAAARSRFPLTDAAHEGMQIPL